MKKRLAALALCVVFTVTLMAAPKARAVLVETAAATLGVAVLGAYMSAIGLSIGADTGETVSSGLTTMVSDYLADTGSSDTAESWFEYIAGFASMPVAGSLRLPASIVKTIGFFVDWVLETFGLDEAGKEAVAVPGTGTRCFYNGVDFPDIETVWTNKETYSYALIFESLAFNNRTFLFFSSEPFSVSGALDNGVYSFLQNLTSHTLYYCRYELINGAWDDLYVANFTSSMGNDFKPALIWSNYDFLNKDGTIYLAASSPVAAGQLGLTREDDFANIANDLTDDSDKELNIVFPETITNLDDLAAAVPDQIAAGTLNPTYELTGTGEGTDTEDGVGADDTTVGLLQSILQGIKAIPDAFTNSLTDVFTPSREAVDSLAAEVDSKLPIIPTLKNFGSGLVYNLEHPETCANGLGLTTIVDLEKGRGTYLGNTKHELLDVSWYLEYKPLVDDIIVGFCWLCFLWNCYGALPRIIHGEGSVFKVASILQDRFEGDDEP